MAKFTTYDGRHVDENDITHQHLSNIYWFEKIFNRASRALVILQKRFNGQILPYRPKFEFKDEISYLDKNKMIREE
jgi:hypothetical protein